jgi:effector-binding domain-containing protein
MKKWLLALILILVVVALILLIPRSRNIEVSTSVKVNSNAFSRCFSEERSWTHWWPGPMAYNAKGLPVFMYKGTSYTVEDKTTNSFIITISRDHNVFETVLNYTGSSTDSIMLSWVGKETTSSNLLARWTASLKPEELEREMKFILGRIVSFYSAERNIYGIDVREEKVMDSLLISSQQMLSQPPSPADYYKMIDGLKDYAKKQNARETNYPMLNIFTRDSTQFLVKVALPVNRKLPGNGTISYKWMLGGGNILVTEIKGGPVTVRSAMKELENYVNDHHRISPAIPYESLLTDRRLEKDTSKWITRVYYPVM